MKRILNHSEEVAFNELNEIATRHGLRVFAKVRVADVLEIENSGLSPDMYTYCLKAHFDFVVTDSTNDPQYAVEFDGPHHDAGPQKLRDSQKNFVCRKFNLPLLRVKSAHISKKYRDATLLAWIINVHQVECAFYEAQSNNLIPLDEPFDPFFILADASQSSRRYPYWLSLDANLRIKALHKKGVVHLPGTSGFIGTDSQDVMRGIEFLQVSATHGLYVKCNMRTQDFPIQLSDLLSELLMLLLEEQLDLYLAGKIELMPMTQIYQSIEEFKHEFKMLQSHSVGYVP